MSEAQQLLEAVRARTEGTPYKVDFTFSSAEGRELIRGPARELGWTEKMGGAEKTGIAVAIGALALAVVVGIVVVVLALTGAL